MTSKWIEGILQGHDPRESEGRYRLGVIEGWVSAGINLVLGAGKLVLGGWTGSISLMADAANNLTDVVSSIVVAVSFHVSRKPRDARHPYGHGRMECISGLVLSVLLVVVGIEVAKAGIVRLWHPRPLHVTPLIMACVLGTIVIKAALALFARRLAQVSNAVVLWADAWNHTFDILCTALVLVALVGARWHWPGLDGWAGVLVSLFIIYTGGKYALETISRLLGEAPSPDEVEKIRGLARDQEGVRGVHDIMVHKYGDMRVISLHIEVDADWSVLDVHELSEQVEDKLERNIPQCKAIVHVDPVDRSHVRYDRLQELMTEFARQHPCMMEFHDLRVDGARDALRMSVDVVLKPETSEAAYAHVRGQLERYLAQHCPSMQHAEISIEPSYHGGTNAGN